MRCYRLLLVFAVTFAAGLPTTAVAAEVATADFYVAPGGKDTWSGRLNAAKPDGSDGPLATLAGARDAIRRLKEQAPLRRPLRVLLRGGTYAVSEPVFFFEGDSGTKVAPISYAAYPGEKPVLSGGVPVTGWQKAEGPLWTTTVPGVKEGRWYFRSLFVDGKRCIPARTPNEGSEFTAEVIKPLHRSMQDDVVSSYGIRYHDQDVKPWSNLDDVVVVVYHAWTAARHCIASVDFAHKIVRFTNRGQFPVGWCAAPRYYVENFREALDAPGEFYLDRKTGLLSYYPRPGEDMTKAQAIAPRPETLLKLEGNAAGCMPVDYLRFEGIAFAYTDWVMPRDEMVDIQSAAFLKTAAILCRGVQHCTFERCDMAHLSGYALWLERGCTDDRVAQCHMYDLGAGGVRIGETVLPGMHEEQTERNEVFNCFIHDGGRVFQAGMGVLIGCSSRNKVLHNEICDLLNSGISVGWSWAHDPTTAHHNAVEYNHIHHLGWGKLSDMGGVYTLGVSPGTTVRYNLIHDMLRHTYGAFGIYLDEASSDILIENNIVYRVQDACFFDHLGWDNTVRNNIFALSAAAQIRGDEDETHHSFTCERNVVYYKQGELIGGESARTGHHRFDYNCYWNAKGKTPTFPGGLSLRQWQAKDQDAHSTIADPQFVAVDRYDFRLKDDSPAFKSGFQPIDTSTIGLIGPADWVALPKQVQRPPMILPGDK